MLRSSITDMGKLLSALTDPKGCCIFENPDSLREMLPESGKGGLAWWGTDAQYSCREPGLFEHGGFMEGVRTHIWLWPRAAFGAAFLCNGECNYDGITRRVRVIAEHYK